ncbi:MAG: DUF4190 domain-containing protein [Flavobacteriales bacterium]|nr:DUF4190 domain-containing protein [Flavobacteriales bacterium]
MKKSLLYLITLVVLLGSCTSSKVVGDGFVMKRKYNKGFHKNFGKAKVAIKNSEEKSEPINIAESSLKTTKSNVENSSNEFQALATKKPKLLPLQGLKFRLKPNDVNHIQEILPQANENLAAYDLPGHQQTSSDAMAYVGLAFGILGLLLFWIPFVGLLFALIGVVAGIVGLNSAERGAAIAGIIMGVIGVILGLGWILLIWAAATI